jgi:HlyD family secretion protein
MQVRAAVDEADIGNVQKGQRVSFTVDAFPEDVFNGTLQEIRLQPSISSNVVTYATIINAPNDQLKLKPGMTANSTIYTKEENNALVISAKATKFKPDSSMMKKYDIVDDRKQRSQQQKNNGSTGAKYSGKPIRDSSLRDSSAKRASVWVLNGKTLTRRFIRTGLEDGTQVQVLSGLTEADVVVDGVQQAGTKANQNNVRSPFMPQRRTQTGSGNRQGGGNNRPSQ